MDYSTLAVDTDDDGITTLTVTRPRARNALSGQVLTELAHFLSAERPTGVVLTGAPGPAFVAGADIREMAAMTPAEGERFGALGQRVTRLVEEAPYPVVAAVDGYALGGGCELVLACDFAYATRKSVLGQPEVVLGLIPGFGGCVRLQRLVGPAVARELIYTGRHVDAEEALRLGLVTAVFDDRPAMLAAARATLRRIAGNSPVAVSLAKAVLNGVRGRTVPEGLDVELAAFREAFTTDDMREGTEAFLAKRPPVFGRTRHHPAFDD
ncbi:enoyl-CoA hydratase/isomerase family protein [Saccharothrix variisporea]|uniref:Short chain enoyl-CoA hydratase n=1 Tax=Saccharothrix variisporea TaxID=543527 RepID=A0A495X314_9PSEU|nr:enoyl-CoA hydratase-related protein [Saccharothrix variisporea]RKT67896.1 short chain enoyl-CoA hydratase [Saccharothrix variisporea]